MFEKAIEVLQNNIEWEGSKYVQDEDEIAELQQAIEVLKKAGGVSHDNKR